jgi:hypothetical protein
MTASQHTPRQAMTTATPRLAASPSSTRARLSKIVRNAELTTRAKPVTYRLSGTTESLTPPTTSP